MSALLELVCRATSSSSALMLTEAATSSSYYPWPTKKHSVRRFARPLFKCIMKKSFTMEPTAIHPMSYTVSTISPVHINVGPKQTKPIHNI
jgi:hypothetical protein